MSTISRCSCIVCHKEYSSKGIHSHFIISHTYDGKIKHQMTSANAAKLGGDTYARNIKIKKKDEEIEYLKSPKPCKHCNTILQFNIKNNTFCSSACSALHNNIKGRTSDYRKSYSCPQCKTIFFGSRKFCSIACYTKSRKMFDDPILALKYKRNRVREASANYRAKLNAQTPINVDRKIIKEFYLNCPKGYEVDHIFPISKGGLHSIENLQYLTIYENRSKGDKMPL